MTFRLCVLVVAGMICAACDGSPAQPQLPVGTSPSSSGFHLTGVVRDGRGDVVAGATVTSPRAVSSVLTNQAGQFDLLFDRPSQAVTVIASKIGYEPDLQFTSESSRDLTLHDIIRIAVGESARVTVGPNDAYLEDENFDGYRIRVVRVMVTESMTVHFKVVADDGGQAFLSVRNLPPSYSPIRNVDVAGATELVVEVRVLWELAANGRTLTLSTSRQPW